MVCSEYENPAKELHRKKHMSLAFFFLHREKWGHLFEVQDLGRHLMLRQELKRDENIKIKILDHQHDSREGRWL